MMIIPQPALPAAFGCTFLLHKQKIKKAKKIKKKVKKNSKIQHINIRTKKGAKKEPNRKEKKRRLKDTIRRKKKIINPGGKNT